MRTVLIIGLATLLSTVLKAQQTGTTLLALPSIGTEAGIFAQTNFDSHGGNMSLLGLQYKKTINDRKGFRVVAGYGNYSSKENPYSIQTSGDTAIERSTRTDIGLGIIGVGVEMQRHFYRKVILYAALEVQGGYGTGSDDTLVRRKISSNLAGTHGLAENNGKANATMYYMGILPAIGAKIQFNRISLGTELTGIEAAYKQVQVKGSSNSGVFDMSLGNITQRIFVNYRF